jgi:hypothetical protein
VPETTFSQTKKPMIEVISEEIVNEEDEDYLILEHFAKLEKLAESNPHTPTEMMKVCLVELTSLRVLTAVAI